MSHWKRPPVPVIWQAIDIFIAHAYDAKIPRAVLGRLEALRGTPADDFFQSSVLEKSFDAMGQPRYALRLGNRRYPHMKFIIEATPTSDDYMFRVDCHDDHVRPPPTSPEAEAFAQLVRDNQATSDCIEHQWRQAGLPTFKAYLRDDLDRRAHRPYPHAPEADAPCGHRSDDAATDPHTL